MSTKRFRLTKAAKILIFLIVLSCIGVGVFFGVKTGIIKSGNDKKICSDSNITSDTDGNVINTDKKDDKTIKKLRKERMDIIYSMFGINNRASMARTKNARLYVRNNNISTNRRKRNV